MIKKLQKILKIKIKTRKLFLCVVLAVLIGLIVGSQVDAHAASWKRANHQLMERLVMAVESISHRLYDDDLTVTCK